MDKKSRMVLVLACLAWVSVFYGFEKLGAQYQIHYGNSDAPTKVVEYFSLSCPKCYTFFKKEFPKIREKHLNDISLVFHPDPADLLTLQAMVCLEILPPEHKPLFLEAILTHIEENKGR